MKAKLLACILTTAILPTSYSQQPIDVTEQTIKIGGTKTEEMYFGFVEGDQIIFSFSEVDKKDLKEVEVIEYPSNAKFSDYKVEKIENKVLNVSKTAVYKFRFYNSSLSGRVCRVKIQRVPGSELTKNYNTAVRWVNQQDTTWNTFTKDVIVGYDTVYEQKTRRELVKTEQKEELIFDKPERIGASTTKDKGYLFFTLPRNEVSAYKTKSVVSWAYWVGVNKEGHKAWEQNSKAVSSLVKSAATYFTTPLGALALGTVTDLATPKSGEDVYYAVTDKNNCALFLSGKNFVLFDKGKGVAGYRKFTDKALSQGIS